MTTPAPWPGDDRPMYNDPGPDDTFPPPSPGYGQPRYGEQAREQVRPEPPAQRYGYQPPPPGYGQQTQAQYGSYQPPPPTPVMPAVYDQGQPRPYYQVMPKNPAIGVLVSFFIPGLGSMIAGKGGKGALILILNIVGWITTLFIIGWFLALGTWIWGMVAGYQDARTWNHQHGIIS